MVSKTKLLIQEIGYKKTAELFEKVTLEDLKAYWDIDGGFESMFLLGPYFNNNHALYINKRLKKNPSWIARPVSKLLYEFYAENSYSMIIDQPCEQACISILNTLLCLNLPLDLSKLIKLSQKIILISLSNQINKSLASKELENIPKLFSNLIWCAKVVKFAVFKRDEKTFRFAKDIYCDIFVEDSSLRKILLSIVENYKKTK